MKKPALISLSLLTLSAFMAMEAPICAATRTYVPSALVSKAVADRGSTSEASTSLPSNTADGIAKKIYAGVKNDQVKKSDATNEDSNGSDSLANTDLSTDSSSTDKASDKTDLSDNNATDNADEEMTTAPFVLPEKLNNLAEDVTPYQLYSLNGKASDLSISGKATSNYKLIKDKLTDKYTMMVYLCGTNLEDNGCSLTDSICRIMQAAPKNMNIVLLCGGTDTYANNYMNKTIGKEKTGIYYLNTEKIPKNVDWDKVINDSDYENVINKNTLVNLATFDKVSIGDPSLLSGFMNLSSDLFPAKDYGLVMWNHGGGVIDGICTPDNKYLKDNAKFNTNDLESALRSSNLVKNGGKLGMVAFDACLMGCSEVAYNLHNYYNYMFASEEMELGDFNYEKMFKQMDTQLGKGTATDYSLIKAIHDNFSFKTKDGENHTGTAYYQQTGGVYDAAAAEKFVTALNNMGKTLNQLIEVAPNEGKDVLSTLAISRLKCDTLYIGNDDTWGYVDPKYADVGELTYFMKSDLTALKEQAVEAGESKEYINAIQKSIDSISALQKTGCLVMSSTWYNKNKVRSYAGKQATSIADMQKKAPASEFWRKAQGTNASYGSSIYFPVVFNIVVDDTLTKYDSFYKGTALSDYSALMTKMINWKLSDEYTAQKNALNQELDGIRKFAAADVEDLGDKTSPQYLVVKFREAYGQDKPADSFGTPMYDAMMTTTGNPQIYAAYSINDADGNSITSYKKVALKDSITGEHFNLADSSMNMQLNTLSGYGIWQKGVTSDSELDFKLLANADSDNDWKKQIITAINNEYTDTDANKYKVVQGTLKNAAEDNLIFVYHVFRQTEDDKTVFQYTGTADRKVNEDGKESYFALKDGSEVSFYDHYTHTKEDKTTELVCNSDHEFTENVAASTQYKITKNANPILLKKFSLGTEGVTFNPNDFVYSTSMDFTRKDEKGDDVIKTEFSGECTTTEGWTADADTNAKADTNADENTNTAENTATDENASAAENTAADENTNTSTDESTNTDANAAGENTNVDENTTVDENTNAAENTNAEQESGAETEASETPVITEEAA